MQGLSAIGRRDLYDDQAIRSAGVSIVPLGQHHDVKLRYSIAADSEVGYHPALYIELVVYRFDLLGQERPANSHASQYA